MNPEALEFLVKRPAVGTGTCTMWRKRKERPNVSGDPLMNINTRRWRKNFKWLGEMGVEGSRATITASVAEKIGTWVHTERDFDVLYSSSK